MAEKSRREQLEEWVRARPTDAFTRYGLAMELKGQGLNDDAAREFQTLVDKSPDYVPSYLIYGQLLVNMNRVEDAKKILGRGQAAAQKAGNMHALGEISELLASL
jgi:thioredoxin-like negative regulator of GroEL